MQASVVVFLLAWFGLATTNEESDGEVHFTNSWAVHIENDDFEAVNNIAQKHGFVNQGQIGSLPGYYHFVKHNVRERSRRSLDDHSDTLLSEPRVKWVEQQRILERSKRDVIQGEDELVQRSVATLRQDTAFTIRDPFFKDQWYLQNIGQSSGPSGVDISVLPVWARGYSGKGVVVSVLDDGLDHTHPDLTRNYDPDASFDFNDFDGDPMPRDQNPENCHGTKCAGEVAAEANNGICGVGVSFNASIGGIRMLDGRATDTIEGSSLSYRSEYIDIYSCCWGPKDDGKRFGKPGHLASKALQIGTQRGRGGKGSIFVWATGNGGLTDDDCNCDGYTTSIYTISIGAISDHGLSTYYTETCASTLAVTFSGGSHRESDENRVVTTDLHHKCTKVFKGTSSAAPLAAGMLALVLEANPTLTWRDVQHVIVESSQVTSPLDEGWKTNGAGKRYNHKFGFGRLDVNKMVEKALRWKNVNRQRICHGASHSNKRFIPNSGSLLLSANTSSCSSTPSEIRRLEHVQINITLHHRHRGDLSITLISPSGTRSKMLTTRRNDHSALGLKNWLFMTVHFWGEDPRGLWTVVITDNDNNNREHYLKKHSQGDEEDVTRIFLDETGKHGEMQTDDQMDHAQDHIMKTMEDTAGKIFRGNRFTVSSRGKKLQHIHDKPSLRVIHKKVSKKNPFNNAAKLHRTKVKEGKLAQFKKHYLKSKAKGKVKTGKGKHHWTGKNSDSGIDAFKGKHVGGAANKHAMFKKLHARKMFNENQGKLKNTLVIENDREKGKKPGKVVSQRLNVTLNMAPKAATNQSTSVASILGKSENATRAFRLISQLISEIQKNPLVSKIAAEALKNPDIGKLFGIESSKDVLENIQETSSPMNSINQHKDDFENKTKSDVKDSEMETRIAERANGSVIASGNKTSDHFETAKQGTINSNKHKHIQFFKILKDNQDHKSDITASGMDGSGGLESGNYVDERGSGDLNFGKILKTGISGCKGLTNCSGTSDEQASLSVSNKITAQGRGENDAYEIYSGDEDDSQYSESTDDGGEVLENDKNPTVLENDDDNDDLIPEFGFNLNSIDRDTSDSCNFSLDSSNASLVVQKAHCLENSTMEKRADIRDAEDKNLAHYLAVDKLNLASGEDSADNIDSPEGSPFKSKLKSDQDNSDVKYDGKDLEVLQEALENQLSRLSKDPASEKSNAEILARVRDDIKHGDIDDLELLEAQITGGKNEMSRDVRSRTPQDNDDDDIDDNDDDNRGQRGGFDEEDEEIERRRISRQADSEKLYKSYYVDPDKYGKDNSGILESWTLILYGTK